MKVFVSVLLLLFQLETNFKTQTALSSKTIIIIFVPFLFILQCGKKTRIKKITKIFTSFLIINSLTVLILAAQTSNDKNNASTFFLGDMDKVYIVCDCHFFPRRTDVQFIRY